MDTEARVAAWKELSEAEIQREQDAMESGMAVRHAEEIAAVKAHFDTRRAEIAARATAMLGGGA
jgi:hypothetical protein